MEMKFDLHLHSKNSLDAINEPRTIVKTFRKKRMGFALTDHETTKGWKETRALAKRENVPFIQGEEVKVYNGKELQGELVCLFLEKPVKASELPEVIDELKEQDAVIIVPHPFDNLRKNFKGIERVARKVDAIEGFNSRCVFVLSNEMAQDFAKKNNLPVTGSSDAHTPEELGAAWTEVSGNSPEDLRKAIKKGKTKIGGETSSIMVHLFTALAKQGLIKPR